MKRDKKQMYDDVVRMCKEKEYQLLTTFEEFKGSKTRIKYICKFHGEREIRTDCLLIGQSCSKCAAEQRLKDRYRNNLYERANKLYDKVKEACENKGYELLSNISDITCNTSYVAYKCPIHGVHETRIINILSGSGCPDCNTDRFVNQMRLDIDEVRTRLKKMNAICLNIDEYINLESENLIFVCEFCHREYVTSLLKFIRYAKHDCPVCSLKHMSAGELKIYNYLCKNNMCHTREKCFDDCRDDRMLPFDFYIPEHDICIEYQGQQHYYPIEVFGGVEEFESRQKHDKIKRDFCDKNNIKLIEIPYWEYHNIEKILHKELLVLHEDIV